MRRAESQLRAWQRSALEQAGDWQAGPFLIAAAPGAGKTRPALSLAGRLLREREVGRVVVLCPTAPLTRQWAAAAAQLGVQLQPDARRVRASREFDGIAVTYARIASDPARFRADVRQDTLVIADEAHHLGEDLAWGASFNEAFSAAKRWLLLSGTPFRSDANAIPGVRYDEEGLAMPDVCYTYAEAVTDGVCRPVAFVTFDGSLSWRSGEDVIESSFETVLSSREASRRYRTAISTELPDGLPRILAEADEKLSEVRAAGHRDAGALAIAADANHAKQIAKLLADATGRRPVVVLHTEARAAEKLARFRGSGEPWIVAVNMVSEGVDIPRLRVGVYASAAKTPLIFRQIVGRFVRTLPGRRSEPSWLYLPADPVLRRHASEVEGELRHTRRRVEDEEGFEKQVRGRQSERCEQLDFEPLSAEVAAQMTLFGSPPLASSGTYPPAAADPSRLRAGEGAREGGAGSNDGRSAQTLFERRERLRQERSRLVADLQRRNGHSHREINAWLNKTVGVTRVEDATIGQLERSIETLVKQLRKASRR